MSAHRAAKRDRTTADWFASDGSADADTLDDLPTIRQRVRELVRNTGVIAGAEQLFVDNVVGCGVRPRAALRVERLIGIDERRARVLEDAMDSVWEEWVDWADSQGRLSAYEIQELVVRTSFHSGECFLVRNMIQDELERPWELAWEVIEADRVETPHWLEGTTDRKIRSGIELGRRGQATRYWVLKDHPGDRLLGRRVRSGTSAEDFTAILARDEFGRPNVLHPYVIKRPGQTHGIAWPAAVAADCHHLRGYFESERVAKKVEACHAAIELRAPSSPGGWQAGEQTPQGNKRIEPGTLHRLPAGADVKFFHPTRPGSNFEAYMRANYREIGAGLGVSLISLLRDYSDANYSSARAALLGDRKLFRALTKWLIRRVAQPMWALLMEEAWAKGALGTDLDWFANRAELVRAVWTQDGWEWIDPLKEARAEEVSVALGVRSRTEICRSKGTEFEDVTRQLADEREAREVAGLGGDEDEEEQDEEEEEESEEEEDAEVEGRLLR